MSPIEGLLLDRGVPPRLEEKHVIGSGEIEPDTSCLERYEKYGHPRVGLKAFDHLTTVARRSVESHVVDAPRLQVGFEKIKHRGPL